jgi:sugar porter (SP) family MFS transporter
MTAAEESETAPGILAELDRRGTTSFYWYLALLATIGGFLFGYDTADIGSVLDFVPYHLSSFETGYLVAGASLGAAVGALLAGPTTDRFGRKSLLIVDAAIYAIGAILSAVSVNSEMLLSSRTLIGLAVGADSAIATAYIAEFAPRNKRGSLSIIQQWMITVGILVSYVIAVIILRAMPDSTGTVDWRLILGLGAIPAILAFALRTRMPESPRWLMQQGRYADTQAALGKLGLTVTEDQVRRTADEIAAIDTERQRHTRWTSGVKRALFVVCGFFIFQQITGINIPFYYGPQLMGDILQGSSSDAVSAAVAGVEVTAIMGAVNVVSTYFGFKYIDRVGRRPLALGGYLGMTVFMLVSAGAVAFMAGLPKTVVVMIGLDLFIASFAIGVGGTGWLIQGEVFPTAVRGRAAAIGAFADWIGNFVIVQFFPTWEDGIGLAWVMVCFSALCVFAIIFVALFLPETKELSVEEVIEVFERQAAGGPRSLLTHGAGADTGP